MKELVFSWREGSSIRSYTIQPNQPSKILGKVRIGRNPQECDLVLPSETQEDLTVSNLHIEIYFDAQSDNFYLRNLKGATNPPKIDGRTIKTETVPLNKNGTIRLGKREFQITLQQVHPSQQVTEIGQVHPSQQVTEIGQVQPVQAESSKPMICPSCKAGYTYEEASQMNWRCYKDGFPLYGQSIIIVEE